MLILYSSYIHPIFVLYSSYIKPSKQIVLTGLGGGEFLWRQEGFCMQQFGYEMERFMEMDLFCTDDY